MRKIQDYAIIGNGRSAALISKNGSLDWLCWPRFDSPSLFSHLIDEKERGFWRISPVQPYKVKRSYIENSNVLETRFSTRSGSLILTDFMVAISEEEKRQALHPEHELIRVVECIEGKVEIEVLFAPAPHYAEKEVLLRNEKHLGYRLEMGQELISLHSSIPLRKTPISLKKGERIAFSLTYTKEGPAVIPSLELVSQKLACTLSWWQQWTSRIRYEGPYKEEVIRGALTLKLLGYAPSGAFIAAPTTSLPEKIGGSLNWDYRYCWLRDASFTVRALLELGYFEEAEAFINWMLHTTRLTQPKLKVLYDVFGEKIGAEKMLPQLTGFAYSQPVRIGNLAESQLQLDLYGTVVDGVAYYVAKGNTLDREMKRVLCRIGRYVCKNWQKKESGIWEDRINKENYTYSKLMCWVALDKLLDMKKECALSKKEEQLFKATRQEIKKEIEELSWNAKIHSYVNAFKGTHVDASLLLLPHFGFQKASSERMKGTFQRISEKLYVKKGLLYREEKMVGREGAFLICSFWYINFLIRCKQIKKAHTLFKELLLQANDVGLFAEEINPKNGDALGNFPQAFTHLGVINTALLLG